jgi:hypothetical protein
VGVRGCLDGWCIRADGGVGFMGFMGIYDILECWGADEYRVGWVSKVIVMGERWAIVG